MASKVKSISLSSLIEKRTLSIQDAKNKINKIVNEKDIKDEIKDNLVHLGSCALSYGKPTLFPKIPISKEKINDPDEYIDKWINKYLKALNNKPSAHVATVKKSVDDPVLKTLIKAEKQFDDKRVETALYDHNLYMSAENIQGSLLEEYIDEHISKYGWIWAEGEAIRACDFIKYDSETGEYILLQIKNKYNSENSSSSAIRSGTQIKKWFRLKQKTVNKQLVPSYNWENLNDIIGHENEMSENDYKDFITRVAHNNPSLL